MSHSNNKSWTKYISFILILGLVLAYFFIPEVQQFFKNGWEVLSSNDEQEISNWVESFGWMGPIVIILAMIIQMFLLLIPSILLMVVAILAYQAFWGSVLILVAIIAASTVGYFIGKLLGKKFILGLLGEKTEQKIEKFIENYGFWAVVITRINPFLSNDAISFVGGILKMGYWRFIGATIVGILPLTLSIAYFGQNIDRMKTALLWGSVIGIVAFVIYIIIDKRKKKKE